MRLLLLLTTILTPLSSISIPALAHVAFIDLPMAAQVDELNSGPCLAIEVVDRDGANPVEAVRAFGARRGRGAEAREGVGAGGRRGGQRARQAIGVGARVGQR